MKSVMYEWKKFRAFRYFWFLCSVFFLFNIWTLSEKMKMEMYDAGAVKQIYADLKAQPEETSLSGTHKASCRKRKFLFIRGMNMQKRCCTTKSFRSTDRSTDTTNILRRSRKKARVCPALFSRMKERLLIEMHRLPRMRMRN